MMTLALAIIVTLFGIPARFIVLARARRMATLFTYVILSDWMTRSRSLVRLRLSEQSQYRKMQ